MTSTIFEITVKLKENISLEKLPKITTSKEAYNVIREYFDKDTFYMQEEFIAVYLNINNRVIGHQRISKGGISSTVVDARLILSTAIKCLASSVIITHNHPSGNTNPSQADIKLTNKIKEAGKFLDITLLDHLIITDESYLSFADESLL